MKVGMDVSWTFQFTPEEVRILNRCLRQQPLSSDQKVIAAHMSEELAKQRFSLTQQLLGEMEKHKVNAEKGE